MRRQVNIGGSDRGAVLVHVAFAILALVAFTTFVVDWGVMWTSRRQSQNSADAGALAGAIALGFDDRNDLTDTGPAKQNAFQATQTNFVWGQAPNVNITTDITFPPCPPPDASGRCIRVDVFRNQTRGNALPIFFGSLVGLTEQGIRAMAMAKLQNGNATDCLKPWAVPDKWLEMQTPDWDPEDTFDRYDKGGALIPNPDVYTPPTANDPGTGYTTADVGTEFILKNGGPQDTIRPGWFSPVVLTGTGGSEYRDNISGCVGTRYRLGDLLTVEPGNMIGPTKQGTEDLIDLDPDADWVNGGIEGGCMDAGTCTLSPRRVALPVYDLEQYLLSKMSGREEVIIRNFVGFFVDRMDGNDVVGYLMTFPTEWDAGAPTVGDDSAFSFSIFLIR